MSFISVNDELQELKRRIGVLGKEVLKVEKLGNGNMSAFELFYRDAADETVQTAFFWRHDIDNFLKKFEARIKEEQAQNKNA